MTGISYEELFEIFEPFGLVEEIQLLPNRSYSFVVFEEIDSTVSAYEAVHGNMSYLKIRNNRIKIRQVSIMPISFFLFVKLY